MAIFVRKSLLERFTRVVFNNNILPGRICRLELANSEGEELHIYGCYLSSSDGPATRKKEMRMIHELLQPNVHNIVTGDFNFTSLDMAHLKTASLKAAAGTSSSVSERSMER